MKQNHESFEVWQNFQEKESEAKQNKTWWEGKEKKTEKEKEKDEKREIKSNQIRENKDVKL